MPSFGALKEAAAKKPKKVLDHLRIVPAENGGHIVEHHFAHFDHESESYAFGAGEGSSLLRHIAKHAGIKHDLKLAEGTDKAAIEE